MPQVLQWNVRRGTNLRASALAEVIQTSYHLPPYALGTSHGSSLDDHRPQDLHLSVPCPVPSASASPLGVCSILYILRHNAKPACSALLRHPVPRGDHATFDTGYDSVVLVVPAACGAYPDRSEGHIVRGDVIQCRHGIVGRAWATRSAVVTS